ncbi:hypothetical protein HDV00_011334 [Rhizophlyctis rosea]|nr:hypothetical protein HDV00_011334 [Rhizophlyctis rosea]
MSTQPPTPPHLPNELLYRIALFTPPTTATSFHRLSRKTRYLLTRRDISRIHILHARQLHPQNLTPYAADSLVSLSSAACANCFFDVAEELVAEQLFAPYSEAMAKGIGLPEFTEFLKYVLEKGYLRMNINPSPDADGLLMYITAKGTAEQVKILLSYYPTHSQVFIKRRELAGKYMFEALLPLGPNLPDLPTSESSLSRALSMAPICLDLDSRINWAGWTTRSMRIFNLSKSAPSFWLWAAYLGWTPLMEAVWDGMAARGWDEDRFPEQCVLAVALEWACLPKEWPHVSEDGMGTPLPLSTSGIDTLDLLLSKCKSNPRHIVHGSPSSCSCHALTGNYPKDRLFDTATEGVCEYILILLLTKHLNIEKAQRLVHYDNHVDSELLLAVALACTSGTTSGTDVTILLAKGANPNTFNGGALRIATYHNHIPMIELLLSYDAGKSLNAYHAKPLWNACILASLSVIDILLSHGADPKAGNGWCLRACITPCIEGTSDCPVMDKEDANVRTEIVRRLLDHGADPVAILPRLKGVVRGGLEGVLKALFERDGFRLGAVPGSVLRECVEGWCAVFPPGLVKASVFGVDGDGVGGAVHENCERCGEAILRMTEVVLGSGCNLDTVLNTDDEAARKRRRNKARKEGKKLDVTLFKDRGANGERESRDGVSLLMKSVVSGNGRMARILVGAGAKVKEEEVEGYREAVRLLGGEWEEVLAEGCHLVREEEEEKGEEADEKGKGKDKMPELKVDFSGFQFMPPTTGLFSSSTAETSESTISFESDTDEQNAATSESKPESSQLPAFSFLPPPTFTTPPPTALNPDTAWGVPGPTYETIVWGDVPPPKYMRAPPQPKAPEPSNAFIQSEKRKRMGRLAREIAGEAAGEEEEERVKALERFCLVFGE